MLQHPMHRIYPYILPIFLIKIDMNVRLLLYHQQLMSQSFFMTKQHLSTISRHQFPEIRSSFGSNKQQSSSSSGLLIHHPHHSLKPIKVISDSILSQTLTSSSVSLSESSMTDGLCAQHKLFTIYYCCMCQQSACQSCCKSEGRHYGHRFRRQTRQNDENLKEMLRKIKQKKLQVANHVGTLKYQLQNVIHQSQQKAIIAINKKIQHVKEEYLIPQYQIGQNMMALLANSKQMLELNNHKYHQLLGLLRTSPKPLLLEKTGDQISLSCFQQLNQIQSIEIPQKQRGQNSNLIFPKPESYTFKIKEFSQMYEDNSQIISECFYACDCRWILKVYPAGYIGPSSPMKMKEIPYLSIYVQMIDGMGQSRKFRVRVEVSNEVYKGQKVSKQFKARYQKGESWGYDRYIRVRNIYRQNLLNYDNSLMIRVWISYENYHELCLIPSEVIKQKQKIIKQNQLVIKKLKAMIETRNRKYLIPKAEGMTKNDQMKREKKSIKFPQISLQGPVSSKIIRLRSNQNSLIISNSKKLLHRRGNSSF